MAFVTHCYYSDMRPFRDRPDILVRGKWQWCLPGAKMIPYAHAFWSYTEDFDNQTERLPVGEIPHSFGALRGDGNPRLTGQNWCGDERAWTEGVLYAERGRYPVDAEGVGLCCQSGPSLPGGVLWDGSARPANERMEGGTADGGMMTDIDGRMTGGTADGGEMPDAMQAGEADDGMMPDAMQAGEADDGMMPDAMQAGTADDGSMLGLDAGMTGGTADSGEMPEVMHGGTADGGEMPDAMQGGDTEGGTLTDAMQGGTADDATQTDAMQGGTADDASQVDAMQGGTADDGELAGLMPGGDADGGDMLCLHTCDTAPAAPAAGSQVWLRAASEAYSNGDPVPVAHDISGNGFDATQATPSLQPTFVTGALNGLAAYDFDGTQWWFSGVNWTWPQSCFAVVKLRSILPANSGSIIGADSSGGQWRLGDHSNQQLVKNDVTILGEGGTEAALGEWCVIGVTYDGTTLMFWRDNCHTGSVRVTEAIASVQSYIGAHWNGVIDEIIDGLIPELIIYPGAVQGADRVQTVCYLKGQYAL